MANATVIENGVEVPLAEPTNLSKYLTDRGYPGGTVVVEHNGDAVAPSQFDDRSVRPGDRLEIVKVVAGG